MRKIFAGAVLSLLLLTGCTANTNINTNTQTIPDNATSTDSIPVTIEDSLLPVTTIFENKAAGYSIQRPANWYWRHMIRSEIGNASPDVNDYFFTDPVKLGGLGSEFLGQFVVEVSKRAMTDYTAELGDLTKSTVTVGGETAERYAGVRSPEGAEQQRVIFYLFVRGGQTYRIFYVNRPNNEVNESLFEKMVASFAFTS